MLESYQGFPHIQLRLTTEGLPAPTLFTVSKTIEFYFAILRF